MRPGIEADAAVDAFRQLRTPDVSAGGVNLVLGFGAQMWWGVAGVDVPGELEPFHAVVGADGHGAPATQHDVWLSISGAEPDVTWQSARAAAKAVAGAASVAAERPGFTYRDGRDITGFIDGTANPQARNAADVALIPRGLAGEGGSYVLAMRWVHDLSAFNELSIEDQERVIGRTKADGIELSDAEKPATAHIARVETVVDGRELELFRRSVPYGDANEYGLYFVAFSAERSRFDRLLARMFGTAGDGIRDRLTDFSRAVSGACYFAPSQNVLNELAGAE